jgi:hypothetical protein
MGKNLDGAEMYGDLDLYVGCVRPAIHVDHLTRHLGGLGSGLEQFLRRAERSIGRGSLRVRLR